VSTFGFQDDDPKANNIDLNKGIHKEHLKKLEVG